MCGRPPRPMRGPVSVPLLPVPCNGCRARTSGPGRAAPRGEAVAGQTWGRGYRAPVRLKTGHQGRFVADRRRYAGVPRNMVLDALTLEQAMGPPGPRARAEAGRAPARLAVEDARRGDGPVRRAGDRGLGFQLRRALEGPAPAQEGEGSHEGRLQEVPRASSEAPPPPAPVSGCARAQAGRHGRRRAARLLPGTGDGLSERPPR